MFTTNFIFLTFAVCWTSPLETSVGVMLTIPLAGLTDTSAGVPVLMYVACNLAAALLLRFCQTPFFRCRRAIDFYMKYDVARVLSSRSFSSVLL
ncbi:hypothetical protein GQ600_13862 [Phytophthora cactorum]|nr:hypothetical protein GQ600_13862 [Phytophthora cactorum]